MNRKNRISGRWRIPLAGASVSVLLGLCFLIPLLGNGLVNFSYDLAFLFRPDVRVEDAVIVEAQDVVQETIICVTKKIQGFSYDPTYGSFKGWLKRLTQWRIADFVRKKQYQSNGKRLPREEQLQTSVMEDLQDPAGMDIGKAWDEEWASSVLEVALNKVKQRISPKVYQMFYFHVCKKTPAKQVAHGLGVKLAEVYLAKYKVSSLVKKEIKALEKNLI